MTLQELVERARAQISFRRRSAVAHVNGMELTLHAVSVDEVEEAYGYAREKSLQDAYLLYIACPELRQVAAELMKTGELKEEVRVAFLFGKPDRDAMVEKVLELSGMTGQSSVFFDEALALKN